MFYYSQDLPPVAYLFFSAPFPLNLWFDDDIDDTSPSLPLTLHRLSKETLVTHVSCFQKQLSSHPLSFSFFLAKAFGTLGFAIPAYVLMMS